LFLFFALLLNFITPRFFFSAKPLALRPLNPARTFFHISLLFGPRCTQSGTCHTYGFSLQLVSLNVLAEVSASPPLYRLKVCIPVRSTVAWRIVFFLSPCFFHLLSDPLRFTRRAHPSFIFFLRAVLFFSETPHFLLLQTSPLFEDIAMAVKVY